MLRKQNRVKTIRGSVGIDGNTLTEEQITAILGTLRDALTDTLGDLMPARATAATRIAAAKRTLGRKWFRRADYLRVHPSVSTATASRDLHAGITDRVLEHRGERRMTEYRFR